MNALGEIPVGYVVLLGLALVLLAFLAETLRRKSAQELEAFSRLADEADEAFMAVDRVLTDTRTPYRIRRSVILMLGILQSEKASKAFVRLDVEDTSSRDQARDDIDKLRREDPDLYDDVRTAMLGLFIMMVTAHVVSPLAVAAVVHRATSGDVVQRFASRAGSRDPYQSALDLALPA